MRHSSTLQALASFCIREFVRALDNQSNDLSYLIEKMQGQPLYAHINLEKGERSELAMLASELL